MFDSEWWIFKFSVDHPILADIIENFVRIILILFSLGWCTFLIIGAIAAFMGGAILLGIFAILATCFFIAICITAINNI